MADIAEIGRRHLADALAGNLHHCTVTEWLDDDGKPVEVYWRPLTGKQQQQIDAARDEVSRVCMSVKVRALDAAGAPVFADVPLVSLVNDYDYSVMRAIAYIIAGDIGQDDDTKIEAFEKE